VLRPSVMASRNVMNSPSAIVKLRLGGGDNPAVTTRRDCTVTSVSETFVIV
jgi:hypothetical protein